MTTQADATALEIRYEGSVPTFGGTDAADFILIRPHHRRLECNLQLARDARAVIEAVSGPLDDEGVQAVLRALAERLYRDFVARNHDVPAILTVRARDVDDAAALVAEAGLT